MITFRPLVLSLHISMASSDSTQKVFGGKYLLRRCFRTKGYLESDRKLLQMVDLYSSATVLLGVPCILHPSPTSQLLQASVEHLLKNLISSEKFQMHLICGGPSLEESSGSSSWCYEWSQPYVGDSGRGNI